MADELSGTPEASLTHESMVASLSQWQRKYLVALQSGSPTPHKIANCSQESVSDWLSRDDDFARAHDAVVAGEVLFPGAGRALALAAEGGLLLDAVHESRDEAVAPRDRATNRRLALEVAGSVGAGAHVGQPAALIQLGVSVHTHAGAIPDVRVQGAQALPPGTPGVATLREGTTPEVSPPGVAGQARNPREESR